MHEPSIYPLGGIVKQNSGKLKILINLSKYDIKYNEGTKIVL